MFFGAAGPIGASVLSTLGLDRHSFVANQGANCLGYAYHEDRGLRHARLCLCSLDRADHADDYQAAFSAQLFGSRLLGRMQEATFKKGFKLIMTLLALNLLRQAGQGLFFS